MIGKTISHFKILKKLGEGGMGVVYKAEDTKLDRHVALKFLPSHLTDSEEEKQRLIHEAKSASALEHPNITTIYEIDDVEGQTFIAMECVEGETLKDKIEKGPVKTKELLNIAIAVADGLNAAHVHDIVHRDIKSDNIMISKTAPVKIMDFGLAKRKGMTKITKTGSTLGTLAYMSPEQAEGLEVDHRSDLFSFGVVMYEMATGQLPFKGEHDAAIMYSIVNESPILAGSINPNIPKKLEEFIHKALEKEVEERYQHADDLGADLKKLKKEIETSRSTITKTHISMPIQSKKKFSNRLVASISGFVIIVLLVVLYYSLFMGKISTASATGLQMIAVLPFENLGYAEDEYFADGITEETTARLSAIQGMGVIARTSAVQYKNTDKSVQQIGKELGVTYILEGTIRWQRSPEGLSRVRITPQLIQTSDATHLWANVYDMDMTDIFKVQTDIAEHVAQALDIKLLEPEREALQAKPTENTEAYDYYLKGLDHNYRGWAVDPQEYKLAIEMLEKAVDLDPEFALAYVNLSLTHSWMYFGGYDKTEERLAHSKTAVDEALRLQPDMPEALIALAYYYYRAFLDYDQPIKLFERIKKARPNTAPDLLGWIQRRRGKWEESVETIEKSFNLNPRSAILAEQQGLSYTYMREYKKADEWYDRAIAIDPEYVSARLSKAYNSLRWRGNIDEYKAVLRANPGSENAFTDWLLLYFLERKYREALDILDTLSLQSYESQKELFDRNLSYASIYYLNNQISLMRTQADSARLTLEKYTRDHPEDPRFHVALGRAYAYLNRKDEAIREGKRAAELLPVSKDALAGPTFLFGLAQIYVITGEYEAALNQLEYLLSIPAYEISIALLQLDPLWDPLRDHPRFQKLMAEG